MLVLDAGMTILFSPCSLKFKVIVAKDNHSRDDNHNDNTNDNADHAVHRDDANDGRDSMDEPLVQMREPFQPGGPRFKLQFACFFSPFQKSRPLT